MLLFLFLVFFLGCLPSHSRGGKGGGRFADLALSKRAPYHWATVAGPGRYTRRGEEGRGGERGGGGRGVFVGWFLNVPAKCISWRICSGNFTCRHTESKAADQTFYLTQSQCTNTGPTSPNADHVTPATGVSFFFFFFFSSYWYDSTRNIPAEAGIEPVSSALEAVALTTRPARWLGGGTGGGGGVRQQQVLLLALDILYHTVPHAM